MLEIEVNVVIDNLFVLIEEDWIVFGGNFYVELVVFVVDQIVLVIVEFGVIVQWWIVLMFDLVLLFDLLLFFMFELGFNLGMMIVEVIMVVLMSENKYFVNFCLMDFILISVNQEDYVFMVVYGVWWLECMNVNFVYIFGVELLCGVVGVEYCVLLKISFFLQMVIVRLWQFVFVLFEDCYMVLDLESVVGFFCLWQFVFVFVVFFLIVLGDVYDVG